MKTISELTKEKEKLVKSINDLTEIKKIAEKLAFFRFADHCEYLLTELNYRLSR